MSALVGTQPRLVAEPDQVAAELGGRSRVERSTKWPLPATLTSGRTTVGFTGRHSTPRVSV